MTTTTTHNTSTTNTAAFPRTPEAHQQAARRARMMQIADTIYAQLGANRFYAMVGAKNLVALDSGLQFDLPRSFARNGINKVQIILEGNDTYTVKAFRLRGFELHHIKTVSGVYADQLRDVFTAITGLDTHL